MRYCMNNKQYYSCERNHYFFGKLMTVRDFETEQVYFNSKRIYVYILLILMNNYNPLKQISERNHKRFQKIYFSTLKHGKNRVQ